MSSTTFSRRTFGQLIGAAAVASAVRAAHGTAAHGTYRPRSECFFGVHLDIQPTGSATNLGRDVTEAMVADFLDQVRPDFVNYDCKGSYGYLSYPSRLQKYPGIVTDSLRVWRKVTAARGIALYVHFCGLWDELSAAEHPDWTVRLADGTRDKRYMSLFSPYTEKLMVPLLLEAADKYDLDGAWVDADSWCVVPDYCDAARERLHRKTGIGSLPTRPGEPGWDAFLEVMREAYREHLSFYLGEVKKHRPRFQLAANWFYSPNAPERPTIPVDYLTGDFQQGIADTRIDGRYLAATGKVWDLMPWGFHADAKELASSTEPTLFYSTEVDLKQQISSIIAQGGGLEPYYIPTMTGAIDPRLTRTVAGLAAYARARQAVCHHAQSVPQIAVLYSKHSFYANAPQPFGNEPERNKAQGVLSALLGCQYSVDMLPDWRLTDPADTSASRYPLIVVPDWSDIGAEAHRALSDLARGGTALIVIGADNVRMFSAELGVKPIGKPAVQRSWIATDTTLCNVSGLWQAIEPAGAQTILARFPDFNTTAGIGLPAAAMAKIGKGHIIGIAGPIGQLFSFARQPGLRSTLQGMVERLFRPKYRVIAPPSVEVVLRSHRGMEYLHLLNTSNAATSEHPYTVDYVPAIDTIKVIAPQSAGRPRSVLEKLPLDIRDTDEGTEIVVRGLALHEALEFRSA